MISRNRKPVPICQLTALVWVLAISLTAMPLSAAPKAVTSGVVYCPLQRQWVRRNEETKVVPSLPLSDLCAASNDKAAFLQKLLSVASKLSTSQKLDLGELFFSFTANGEQVLAQQPSSPEMPRAPLAVVDTVLGGIVTNRVVDLAAIPQIFSLEQLSRPPTNLVEPIPFSLASKGRRMALTSISPRGPPAV